MADEVRDVRRAAASMGVLPFCAAFGIERSKDERGKFVCPRHGGSSLSVRVDPRSRELGAHCFGCDFSGDVLSLAAEVLGRDLRSEFRTVLSEVASVVGVRLEAAAPFKPLTPRPAPPPPEPPKRLPSEEVGAFWESLENPAGFADLGGHLKGRGLDADRAFRHGLLRAIPEGSPCPSWATFKGKPWTAAYRLVVPVYDASGTLAGVRGWRIDGVQPKRVAPAGVSTAGLVMADLHGQALLRGEFPRASVTIVEGEPDHISACLAYRLGEEKKPAVLGIVSGAWTDEIAARIPSGTFVRIATDADLAGDAYAKKIAESLWDRCSVVRVALQSERGSSAA